MSEAERRARLERLFGEHAGAVRAYARRRIDSASADDVVSEVFVATWRRLDDVPADPLPWLLACARRVLANQRRGERRRSALTDSLARFAAGSDGVGRMGDGSLAAALAVLREDDRELLMLIAWEGLSSEQAAAALGCSRGTLAVRLHRARRRLSTAIDRVERDVALAEPMEGLR